MTWEEISKNLFGSMTEKRFQYNVNKNTIEQDGKFVVYMNSVDGVRIANKLNVLQNENEQLRQRNTNQYNQLTELWQIIEEENWEKLIAMKKQLKEDEERLQQEWKCYE